MARLPISDRINRRILPRLVVVLARIDGPARFGARLRRRLGRRGRVELYFAFDNPNSAVAVIDLTERLAEFDVVMLPRPVVRRGIPDDPAVEDKRRFAIEDAERLFRRSGLTLARRETVAPEATAFLAGWVAAAPPGPALTGFCAAAMKRLWLENDLEIEPSGYANLWREFFGSAPPVTPDAQAVRRNERRMKRRGPYDTPAVWIHGQWFFAHDRLPQIADRLEQLGWRKTR